MAAWAWTVRAQFVHLIFNSEQQLNIEFKNENCLKLLAISILHSIEMKNVLMDVDYILQVEMKPIFNQFLFSM